MQLRYNIYEEKSYFKAQKIHLLFAHTDLTMKKDPGIPPSRKRIMLHRAVNPR